MHLLKIRGAALRTRGLYSLLFTFLTLSFQACGDGIELPNEEPTPAAGGSESAWGGSGGDDSIAGQPAAPLGEATSGGAGASNGSGLRVPKTPVITEPAFNGRILSGADVHMETAPFEDQDSAQQHSCTDWEIWREAPRERVWVTACISGLEKLHTHLADGQFENSHVGLSELEPETNFILRVRHKDDSGDPNTEWSAYAERTFRTDAVRPPVQGDTWVTADGFLVEEVAAGLTMPVNLAFVPNADANKGNASKPYFYVSELLGTIKVVRGDLSVSVYASNLVNYASTNAIPGSGEQGLTGIAVEPVSGDVFVSHLFSQNGKHYPRVVRLTSSDGGLTASGSTVLLDMSGEEQGQSHQVSNVSIGPDGKLYVHMGDGFKYETAANLESFRGKILRMNLDGTPAVDNPLYNGGTITARDYIFAWGFRNPFGGTFRKADQQHYEVSNGPSVDRLAKVTRGQDFEWNNTDQSMRNHALYNWSPSHGPVNITFIEKETFAGSGFPESRLGNAYVSESGPTYASGPQTLGKRIVEFKLDANGNVVSGPNAIVEYNGRGKSSVVGLAAGPDGLYFSDLYREFPSQASSPPTEAGGRIFRVRYDATNSGSKPPLLAFSNVGFGGSSQRFEPGIYEASKGEFGKVADDSLSSLRVGLGFLLLVCQYDSADDRANGGDLGFCRMYSAGDHPVLSFEVEDQVSLMALLGPETAGDAVSAFSDNNFGGVAANYGVGLYEGGHLDPIGNDAISSLKVQPGYRLIACQHDTAGGRLNASNLGTCRYYAAGEYPVLGDLDDQISTFAIARAP